MGLPEEFTYIKDIERGQLCEMHYRCTESCKQWWKNCCNILRHAQSKCTSDLMVWTIRLLHDETHLGEQRMAPTIGRRLMKPRLMYSFESKELVCFSWIFRIYIAACSREGSSNFFSSRPNALLPSCNCQNTSFMPHGKCVHFKKSIISPVHRYLSIWIWSSILSKSHESCDTGLAFPRDQIWSVPPPLVAMLWSSCRVDYHKPTTTTKS